METPAMQFYRQAKVQFEAWLGDPACDLEPEAIRECVADCEREMRKLREREAARLHP